MFLLKIWNYTLKRRKVIYAIVNLTKPHIKKQQHNFHYLKENNYASSICTPCNLKLRIPFFLPVVIHSLSYDLSLSLKEYDETKFEFNINKKTA